MTVQHLQFLHLTDKAIRVVEDETNQQWVPLSQLKMTPDEVNHLYTLGIGDSLVLKMPAWLATEKEFMFT